MNRIRHAVKNVLIAIVLLGLAAGLTLLNALWVDAKMASLLALATEDRPKEALEEFLAAEPFLALTVHEAALKNVEIEKLADVGDEPLIKACNFSRITMENVNIQGNAGECLILAKSQGETVFRNVTCSLNESEYVKLTDEEFDIETV